MAHGNRASGFLAPADTLAAGGGCSRAGRRGGARSASPDIAIALLMQSLERAAVSGVYWLDRYPYGVRNLLWRYVNRCCPAWCRLLDFPSDFLKSSSYRAPLRVRQDYDGNLPIGHVLLMWNTLVRCDEDFVSRLFGIGQQVSVSWLPSILRSAPSAPRAQAAHGTSPSACSDPAILSLPPHCLQSLGLELQHADCAFRTHVWEIFDVLVYCCSPGQVLKEACHGDPCSLEAPCAAHAFRIAVDSGALCPVDLSKIRLIISSSVLLHPFTLPIGWLRIVPCRSIVCRKPHGKGTWEWWARTEGLRPEPRSR